MIKVNGSCHCGEITFEAELEAEKVGICHCTDCQSLSGSAFRTIAIVSHDNFRMTKGHPQEYVKTGESGNRRIQAFCPECGTGLYATNADGPRQAFNLRVGALEQRRALYPQFECWTHSTLPWVTTLEKTKKFSHNPG